MWATPASKQSKLSILKPYFESEVDHKSSYRNKNIFQVYGLVYFFVTSEIILVVASRFEFGAEKAVCSVASFCENIRGSRKFYLLLQFLRYWDAVCGILRTTKLATKRWKQNF